MIKKSFVIKNADGEVISTLSGEGSDDFVGMELFGQVVHSYEQLPDIDTSPQISFEEEARIKRNKAFAATIDRLNPMWYSSLSQSDLDAISTWRQQWLEYPTTGVKPDDSLINHIFFS